MATNGAPDSWDDDVETNNVTNKFTDLNVEAPSFVPNVNASVFVPSWLPAAKVEDPTPVPAVASQTTPSPPTPTEDQSKMQV